MGSSFLLFRMRQSNFLLMFRLMMSGSQGFNKQADYTQQTVTKLTYEDACRKAYQ